jgi:N-acetylglucosamine kinase-like BadF-type ATPase
MSYFIGIDGGGTKTNCVLCDESLKILHQKLSGPSNFLTIGTDKVSDTIIELIRDCCKSESISAAEIKNITIGTTGAGRESDAKKLHDAVVTKAKSINIELNSFKVVSDARIALEGAFSGTPGSILIAGTGSIMFGKDKNGIVHRVGGFGRLIGDEGSGLTLGRKGLNLISKYYDGRGKETSLTKKVEKQFGISGQSELIIKVYSENLSMQDIAPLVIESANEGDELCRDILDQETNELLLHILAMRQKLNEDKMKLVFIGGTITTDNAYSDMLKEKIKTFTPDIIIQQSDYPPEIGAVIMAKQK